MAQELGLVREMSSTSSHIEVISSPAAATATIMADATNELVSTALDMCIMTRYTRRPDLRSLGG